jgi:hypothetical protein
MDGESLTIEGGWGRTLTIIIFLLMILGRLTWMQQRSFPIHSSMDGWFYELLSFGDHPESCSVTAKSEIYFPYQGVEELMTPYLASEDQVSVPMLRDQYNLEACVGGVVQPYAVVKKNQWYLAGAVLLIAFAVRLICSSWVAGLIAAMSLLSRGALTDRIGDISGVMPLVFLGAAFTASMIHFLRSGSGIAMVAAGLAAWALESFDARYLLILPMFTMFLIFHSRKNRVNQTRLSEEGAAGLMSTSRLVKALEGRFESFFASAPKIRWSLLVMTGVVLVLGVPPLFALIALISKISVIEPIHYEELLRLLKPFDPISLQMRRFDFHLLMTSCFIIMGCQRKFSQWIRFEMLGCWFVIVLVFSSIIGDGAVSFFSQQGALSTNSAIGSLTAALELAEVLIIAFGDALGWCFLVRVYQDRLILIRFFKRRMKEALKKTAH